MLAGCVISSFLLTVLEKAIIIPNLKSKASPNLRRSFSSLFFRSQNFKIGLQINQSHLFIFLKLNIAIAFIIRNSLLESDLTGQFKLNRRQRLENLLPLLYTIWLFCRHVSKSWANCEAVLSCIGKLGLPFSRVSRLLWHAHKTENRVIIQLM